MKSLCVIDDDPIVVFGLRKMLEHSKMNAGFLSFENGQDALDFLIPKMEINDEETPDVIFLDLNMPIMNGWEFIEEYVKINVPTEGVTPVLYVVSSSIHKADHDKADRISEVSGFIIKPVTLDELDKVLQTNGF